ncbi:MAG: helix-turn-helix transcriptional regulator [Agathobacter sp.]|nr:helix-turn-helix transcriptional regulator [Agathobacter sp.]
MTVAEMIKKTRIDNNMTQEEYANKFFISRQTVSSWENGRSIPELQTLIDICNTYKMSLDLLLNDDSTYVKKITMTQKVVRKLKYILPTIIVLLCVYFIYYGAWNVRNNTMVNEYNERVLSLGYVRDGKAYELHDKNITYHAGNQELPALKWDFVNKSLSAYYCDDEMIWDISFRSEDGVGYFYFQVNVDSSIAGTISTDGIIEYTEITGLAESVLEDNKAQIEKIVETMNHHWKVLYD